MPRSVQAHIRDYLARFRVPAHEIDVSFARWVIFGFFIYKLLSRDFTTFAYMPGYLLEAYPAYIFNQNFYALMGVPFITDLASFHWVHWFLPMPGAQTLFWLQYGTAGLCLLTCLLGRGPKNLLAIASYVMVSYLWGYIWRSANEVDAVFLALGCMLVYCCSNHREYLTLWRIGKGAHASEAAGWALQGFLMVFVIYYFASGLNKLIDISLIDWLRYDLVQAIEYERDRYKLGYYKNIPGVFEIFRGQYWINDMGVIAVYLSHLLIPIIFYDRSRIPYFWYFYALFHFMSWGVGILFTGNFIMWFAFLPLSRFFYKMQFEYPPQATRPAAITVAKYLNWTGRIVFVPNAELQAPRLRMEGEAGYRSGFHAWRRLLWGMPLLWPLLPVVYLPGSNYIGRMGTSRHAAKPKQTPHAADAAAALQDVAALKAYAGNALIYDGECPFCSQYVHFLRLQQAVGPVALLNARACPALVADLATQGMDVNRGMVWAEQGRLYYDHEAIHRLALLTEDDHALNTLNRMLFSNPTASKLLYPVLKFGRAVTLKLLRRKPIAVKA